jgi:hypothetical protein
MWRADLLDRLTDEPGTFAVPHYHPEFFGNQPCPRVWDTEQLVSCGAGPSRNAWPLDPDDSAELSSLAAVIGDLTRQFYPERCSSAAKCFSLTRDARESVQLMMQYMRQPDLLDLDWVAPWRAATN